MGASPTRTDRCGRTVLSTRLDERGALRLPAQMERVRPPYPQIDFEAYDRERADADRIYAGIDPLRRHRWANEWVKYALRKGILVKPDKCENCRCPAKATVVNGRTMVVPGATVVPKRRVHTRSLLQAHHPDYHDLNRVEWLCDRCHDPMHPPHLLNRDGFEGEHREYVALRAAHGGPVRVRRA